VSWWVRWLYHLWVNSVQATNTRMVQLLSHTKSYSQASTKTLLYSSGDPDRGLGFGPCQTHH